MLWKASLSNWCFSKDLSEVRKRQWHPTLVLLPGKSHGRRSLVGCSPWGREELDTTERLHFHFSLSCIGEGNGNPLQCSCLENPRDGEPGGLPSMGSHRVRHNWSNLAANEVNKPSKYAGEELPRQRNSNYRDSLIGLCLGVRGSQFTCLPHPKSCTPSERFHQVVLLPSHCVPNTQTSGLNNCLHSALL